MNTDTIRACLAAAAAEVLETMFFAAALPCPPPEDTNGWTAASIAFSAPAPGRFTLALPPSHAALLAANFLACDPAALEPGQADAVAGEMANMICGASLSRLYPDAHIELASPRLHLLAGSAPAEGVVCNVDSGDGPLAITLWLEKP